MSNEHHKQITNAIIQLIQNPRNHIITFDNGGMTFIFDHEPKKKDLSVYYKDWQNANGHDTHEAFLVINWYKYNINAYSSNGHKFLYDFGDEQWKRMKEAVENSIKTKREKLSQDEKTSELDFINDLLESQESKTKKIKSATNKVKHKNLSGVVIADKIAGMKRSGKVKGDITPTKGKELREQIMKKLNSKGRK